MMLQDKDRVDRPVKVRFALALAAEEPIE